jgi:hypothetical protein
LPAGEQSNLKIADTPGAAMGDYALGLRQRHGRAAGDTNTVMAVIIPSIAVTGKSADYRLH